jgi:hypothetical protein
MKLDNQQKLFFGYKIDSKLREALYHATPGNRRYFEDPESEFLRIAHIGDDKWIGKIVKPGVSTTDVEDVQRNVISILRRVAPAIRHTPSYVKIFAIADENLETVLFDKKKPAEDDDAGPYIDE